MAQPDPYNVTTNFTVYAAANPNATYPPALFDTEFANIEATLDDICTNLVLIQRDDGALKNAIVTLDSLSSNVLTFMSGSTSAWLLRGAWITARAYAVYDVVVKDSNTYVCCTAHTSGTFATDLAAVKWILIATFDVADNAISTAKIQDLAVTTAKINDLGVTTAKINTAAVTQAKIANNAVGNAQMADDAIDIAELAHKTLGQLYSFGASGVPEMIAAGTTRQVLQVTATGIVPSFAGHGGDWGIVLGVADITTTSALSIAVTNYPSYLMMIKGLVVDTDNVSVLATVSINNASTYVAAGYRYHVEAKLDSATTYAATASASDSSIPIIANLGNAVTETADIFLFVHNTDGNGSRYVNFSGWVVYRNTSTVLKGGNFIGGCDTASDVTNLKVATSSGNMTGGRIIIYGIGEGL